MSAPLSAVACVDRQLAAFNRGDADGFALAYAPDAIDGFTSDGASLMGREAILAHYAATFAAMPDLHATIEGRLVAGNLVTDHELIQPLNVRAIAVYQVTGDLIQRAWLFGPVPA
jgi:uncharacterized protein (TIGR02246 family)